MQRLIGDGMAFIHAGGTIIKKNLEAGEVIKLDTGCLVAMTTGIDYDAIVSNVRSAIFGGEVYF